MEIKLSKNIFFEEIKLLHDKVSIIFGKSGSGKTQLLKRIYKKYEEKNKLINRFEKNSETRWFHSDDPQLREFIAVTDIVNDKMKKLSKTKKSDLHKRIVNIEIKKLFLHKEFDFEIIADPVAWYKKEFESEKIQGYELSYKANGKIVPVNNLSDGQKIITYLAIDILFFSNKKDIYLMDEPLNRVHHSVRKKIINWMYKLEPSFIIATHNIDLISQETLLSVKYLTNSRKISLHNSFRLKEFRNESIYDHLGDIFKKIGGANMIDAWMPSKAFIVEGPSDFIYFFKNNKISEFLKRYNYRIVIAGSKEEISKCVDKLIGNSKEIFIFYDYDDDLKAEEKIINEINIRNDFIQKVKSDTKRILMISTNEIDGKSRNIEKLFFNKEIENDKKTIYAYRNANNISPEIIEKLIIKLFNKLDLPHKYFKNRIVIPGVELLASKEVFLSIIK